jgi:hypothetical protein
LVSDIILASAEWAPEKTLYAYKKKNEGQVVKTGDTEKGGCKGIPAGKGFGQTVESGCSAGLQGAFSPKNV